MKKNFVNLTKDLSISLENHFWKENLKLFKQKNKQNVMNFEIENQTSNKCHSEKTQKSLNNQDD